MAQFAGLSAVLLNCSIVHDAAKSHTRRLMSRVAGIMNTEGVDVELIHVLDHRVGFGMVKTPPRSVTMSTSGLPSTRR